MRRPQRRWKREVSFGRPQVPLLLQPATSLPLRLPLAKRVSELSAEPLIQGFRAAYVQLRLPVPAARLKRLPKICLGILRSAWSRLVSSRVDQLCPNLRERAIGKGECRTSNFRKRKAIPMLLSVQSPLFYLRPRRPNSELVAAFSATARKRPGAQQGRRQGRGPVVKLKEKIPSLATSVQQSA